MPRELFFQDFLDLFSGFVEVGFRETLLEFIAPFLDGTVEVFQLGKGEVPQFNVSDVDAAEDLKRLNPVLFGLSVEIIPEAVFDEREA